MRSRRSRTGSEGGAAALAIPVAVILVVVASLGLGDLGAFVVARARAQTAADAAALAAAVEIALHGPQGQSPRRPGAPGVPDKAGVPDGPRASAPGAAEEQARRLAAANGARLVTCWCPGSAGTPRLAPAWPRPGPVPPRTGGSASRTVVVEVDVPVHVRLLPGPWRQIHVPASARADVREP